MAASQRLPDGLDPRGRATNTRVRVTSTANAIRILRKWSVRIEGQDEQIGRVRTLLTRIGRGCTTLTLGSTHITEISGARGMHGILLGRHEHRRQTGRQIRMPERAAEVMSRGKKIPIGRCINIQRNLNSNTYMSIQWSEQKPVLGTRNETKLLLSSRLIPCYSYL